MRIKGDISLDTSVVMRLLTAEPEDQYARAFTFLAERLQENRKIYVSELVLAEAYFALQFFYELPKNEALKALLLFTTHSGISISPTAASVLSQPGLATANPGFVDRLIHGSSRTMGHTLATFEKAAKKLASTHIL